ncbi:MAG: hypothetical protein OIF32_07980 [Campylobacterales bacterium]|nr:hypothetical protein [Campylobacterales bacterium]
MFIIGFTLALILAAFQSINDFLFSNPKKITSIVIGLIIGGGLSVFFNVPYTIELIFSGGIIGLIVGFFI